MGLYDLSHILRVWPAVSINSRYIFAPPLKWPILCWVGR